MKAIFQSSRIHVGEDGRTLVVEGTLEEGDMRPGMLLLIAMNRCLALSVPISQVTRGCGSQVVLTLDCEDEEAARLLASMDFEGDRLEIVAEA